MHDTKYYQHKLWYYIPSILDPFSSGFLATAVEATAVAVVVVVVNQWSPISPQLNDYLSHMISESTVKDKWTLDSTSEISCHGDITPLQRIEPTTLGLHPTIYQLRWSGVLISHLTI